MTETITADELKFLCIGIDPGVNTGIAVYDMETKGIISVNTVDIHIAMNRISGNKELIKLVRFEDARLRKYITGGREKLQGAGSIKRDCKIWEDYLTWLGIPFQMVAPKDNRTKLKADRFEVITGYLHSTNEHGRDAAMLVYGL